MNKLASKVNFFLVIQNLIKQNAKAIIFFALIIVLAFAGLQIYFFNKDKKAFLESLNHDQFAKIQTFFETMPTLKHEVEVTNPKTKVKSTVTLEGMNSFF